MYHFSRAIYRELEDEILEEPVLESQDPNTWYSVAQNFRFTVITTLFHNTAAPEGWTFETREQYPI